MSLEKLLEEIIRRVIREEFAAAKPAATVEHVTPAAYAAAHSIGVSTVRRAIREGRLPAIKVGRAVRVPANAELGERIKPATPSANADEIRAARVRAIVGGRS